MRRNQVSFSQGCIRHLTTASSTAELASSPALAPGRHDTSVRSTTLRNDTMWALFGGIAQSGQSFFMIFLLSRYATPKEVGHYALGIALMVPFHLFADRTIRTLQATTDTLSASLAELLGFRWLIACAATLVTLLGVACWLPDDHLLTTLFLVSCQRTVEGLAQVLYGPLHRTHQMRTIGSSLIWRSTVSTLTAAVVLVSGGHLHDALVAVLISQSIVVSRFDIAALRRLSNESGALTGELVERIEPLVVCIRNIPWRSLFTSSLPLALTTFLVAACAGIPRLILAEYAGDEMIAALTMVGFLSFPASIGASSIMQAALPRMGRWQFNSESRHRSLPSHLIRTCGTLGLFNFLAICLAGPWIMRSIFGTTYQVDFGTMVWLSGAMSIGFISAVPATFLTAQKHYYLAAISCLVTFCICLLASFVLIPTWSVCGAAIASLVTNLSHGLISAAIWRKLQSNHFQT